MKTRLFYEHESDSKIMLKKDRTEIRGWTERVEYINEELQYLLDIEDRMMNNANLYTQLHSMCRENVLLSSVLYRYETSMRNASECDTTACDAYYLNNHEKNRNTYVQHKRKYRDVKEKVLSMVLLNAKPR